jgi:chromosomal replication initiator protein
MIESLANKTMNKFHEKYRTCDILLIDDIQFIAGKTSTQEEFFHTFNTLHENCSQIVLSSDRPPKDIATLEDRLKTRFEWGLIADIQPPDLELRIAIIKKKAEQADIRLSDDVATFLAENLRSNIRQIEGTIKKLSVIAFVEGRDITMDIAASCLQELTGGVVPTQVIIDKVFTCINKKYGIDKKTLIGKSRTKDVAFTRHVAIYLIREMTDMSYPSVGKIFDRNHSTVISSCETIEKKISSDPMFLITISDLKKDIEGLDTV